jgi:hypothetical protein
MKYSVWIFALIMFALLGCQKSANAAAGDRTKSSVLPYYSSSAHSKPLRPCPRGTMAYKETTTGVAKIYMCLSTASSKRWYMGGFTGMSAR